ncbi:MAG: YlxR family protein [Microbacteriaceae bacterium]
MNPVRTCIGCRVRDDRASLTRVVLQDSVVVVDQSATMLGRGAWVHLTESCVTAAVKRGGFARSFRRGGHMDTTGLTALIGK